MGKYDNILKANCCCKKNDKIIYVTEGYGLFAEFNPYTGETKILDWPLLEERASKIFFYKNKFYAINSQGKWIAKLNFEQKDFQYIKIHRNTPFEGYLYLCVYRGKLYMLHRNTMNLIIFDLDEENFTYIENKLPEYLKNIETDVCSWLKDCLYIFCSNNQLVIKFSLNELKILSINKIIKTAKFVYAVSKDSKIYILANNTIYQYDNDELYKLVGINNSEDILTKFCITDKKIWLLPGQGNNIYIYSLENASLHVLECYPNDYIYEKKYGWTKFNTWIEINNEFIWLMRVGNYSLRINKVDDKFEWIEHFVDDENVFISRVFERVGSIDEKFLGCEEFCNYIKKID